MRPAAPPGVLGVRGDNVTRNTLFLSILALSVMARPVGALAQGAAPPDGRRLLAAVKVVEGTVETRPAPDRPWTPAKVGMQLAEGADIRTGFRARCVFDMVDSLVQADPLTVVRIAELHWEGDTVRTRLVIKHGNTHAEVEKQRIKSDFAIVTPAAVLSVRGTRGIECGFFPDRGGNYALATAGLIAVADTLTGSQTPVRPGERTDDRATPPMQRLIDRRVSIALDAAGLEALEKRATTRADLSAPSVPPLRRRREHTMDRTTVSTWDSSLLPTSNVGLIDIGTIPL